MYPTISSPGNGEQHFAKFVNKSPTPKTSTDEVKSRTAELDSELIFKGKDQPSGYTAVSYTHLTLPTKA